MKTFAYTVFAAALIAGPSVAQQPTGTEQLTPEEITTLRELVVQQQINETNTPDEIEAVRRSRLEAERAQQAVGIENDTNRVLENRAISINSQDRITPYPILPLSLWLGTTTSLSFFDEKGLPWPVQSFGFDRSMLSVNDSGCAGGAQNVGAQGDGASSVQGVRNILNVTPCNFWTTASVQVVLSGETKPIVFDIRAGSEAQEAIVDANVAVSVNSSIDRPMGRTVAGDVDLGWIEPLARTMTIDPIDTTSDRRANSITLARDVTTDISFMDGNRAQWPIQEVVYTRGIVAVNGECAPDIGGLEVYEPTDDASTFWATLCQPTRATIGVKLKGRAGAISLLVLAGNGPNRQPDGTLTIRVNGTSPLSGPQSAGEAAMAAAPQTIEAFDPDRSLDDFLAGAPLEGSTPANVAGGGNSVQGWFYKDALYLRGPFFVVNPAFDATAQSFDGTMRVYRFNPPVSRLLVSSASGSEAVLNISY